MTDKELLELAAKAAGITLKENEYYDHEDHCAFWHYADLCTCGARWSPLTNDGDALRLAVKLSLTVNIGIDQYTECQWLNSDVEIQEPFNGDPYAATRRAIVRAAAEIRRTLK